MPLPRNYSFSCVATLLPGHSMREDSFYLGGYLDNLNTGEYRIVKKMSESVPYEITSADLEFVIATGITNL